MLRRLLKFWTAVACLTALGLVAWKVQNCMIQQWEMESRMTALEAKIESLGEQGRKAYWDLAKWYNYHLEQGTPGLWSHYESVLNLGDGVMAVMEIPDLGLRLPVFHGNKGPVGHDRNMPLPIAGRGNHTVLFLSESYGWSEGMPVYIDCLGQRLIYRVESVQVVLKPWPADRPTEAGEDLLTLIYDREDLRTLVRCVRCQSLSVRESPVRLRWLEMTLVPPAVLVAGAGLRWCTVRTQKRLFYAFLVKKLRKNQVISKL